MRVSAILTIGFLTLAGTAKAEPAHVTCVGDSITFGVGTANASTDAYPAQLQKLLGPAYAVQNDGHSGATMLISGDLPYTSVAEYTASTAWAAPGGDVIIQLGTNDSKPQNWAKKASFQADCESLVGHYQASAGKPRVWVSLPPPVFDPSCCGISSKTMRDEVIPLLKQCAASKGAMTIDVFGALAGQPAHFADGVHPDTAAALIIAQTVQTALAKEPSVVLASSAPSFTLPAPVVLKVTATAAYGKVEQIEIFDGATFVTKFTPPTSSLDISLPPLPAGTHAFYAVATETGGRTAKSTPPLEVIVEASSGPSAPPPASASPPPASAPRSSGGGCTAAGLSAFVPMLALSIALIVIARRRRR